MLRKTFFSFSFTLLLSVLYIGCSGNPEDVDTVPPEVILQSPDRGMTDIPKNAEVTATFDKSVVGINGSLTAFTIQKVGSFGNLPANISYNDTTFTATLDPINDLEPDSVYAVTLTSEVKSRTGIEFEPIAWTFVTKADSDTTPPTIVSKTPDADAKYVISDTKIKVEFSEAMQSTSIVSQNFYLMKGSVLIPSTLKSSDKTVILSPDEALLDWTDYTVVITDGIKDIAGNRLSQIQWTFKTDDQNNPAVISRVPDNGDTVPTNTVVTVVFSESIKSYTIHNTETSFVLKKDFGDFAQIPASVTYNDLTRVATLSPGVELESGKKYRIILTDAIKDWANNPLALTEWTFTILDTPDATPPKIEFRNPDDNNTGIATNSSVTVVFSEKVNGVNSTNFTLEKSSGGTVEADVTYNNSTNTASLTPKLLLAEGIEYKVTCTSGIEDIAGNDLALTEWTFVTQDITKPVVLSKTPEAVGNVGVNTSISVNFSEKILLSTLSFSSFRFETEGVPVSGEVSYDPLTKTATFNPDGDLEYNTTYTVTLTNGITDLLNNRLNTMSWNFTTGTAPDTTPPSISSRNPLSGAENVSINTTIIVTFSEPVTGVSASNVVLKQGTNSVSTQMNYDPLSKTATLLPDETLANNTTYTVVVGGTSGIKDVSGNDFAADQWVFTTAPDTTSPIVSYKIPAPGMPDIPGNTLEVTALFSEKVTGADSSSMRLRRDSSSTDIQCNVVYTEDTGTNTYKAVMVPVSAIEETGNYTVVMTSAIKDIAGNTLVSPTDWTIGITSIDDIPPEVMVATPALTGSQRWTGNRVQVIFSEDVKNVNSASFYITPTSGGNHLSSVVTYTRGLLTAELVTDAVLTENTSYTAHLTSAITDNAGNQLVDLTWDFTTDPDTTSPTVLLRIPANGTNGVPIGSNITATFSEPIENYSTASFYLTPSVAASVSYDAATEKLTLNPTGNLAGNTIYTATLTSAITDLAANSLANISWQFTTQDVADETPPTVLSVTPSNNATGVNQSANIIVTFSEDVSNAESKIFISNNGSAISTNITYSNTGGDYKATVNPTELLNPVTVYTITVKGGSTGVQDTSGNTLAGDHVTTFTTEADVIAPTVISNYPVSGQTGVPLKPSITITFSEPVTGVNSTTVALYQGGAKQNTYYVTYDSPTRTATLVPNITANTNGNLSNTTIYTVSLTNAIKDMAGNSLASTAWNFTTASLPVITSTLPAMNATGILTDLSSIELNFNQEMNPLKSWVEITDNTGVPPPVIAGEVTWSSDKKTAHLNLVGKLRTGSTYTVKLYGWGGTFEDTNGNTLDRGTVISGGKLIFTAGTDNIAPVINSTIPALNSINVGRNIPKIVIRFNEPMDPFAGTATFTGGNLSSGTWVEGNRTVIYDISSLSLSADTLYTVNLSGFTDGATNGTGYTTGRGKATSGGNGTGCTVRITSVTSGGGISGINATPTLGGSGYSVGDILNITTGGSGGICIVTSITNRPDTTGVVSGVQNGPFISGNILSGTSFSFTTGTSTVVTELLQNGDFQGESFETYSSPYFNSFRNLSTDLYDWQRITWADVYPNYSLAVPSGVYICKASSFLWEFGDYAEVGLVDYVDLTSAATYILSFKMIHERLYNRTDNIEVYVSTDGGLSYFKINAGVLGAVYRYDYSLTNNNPAWHTHYYDLSSYSGKSAVKVKLRGISAGETGGNVLIDDVRITKY